MVCYPLSRFPGWHGGMARGWAMATSAMGLTLLRMGWIVELTIAWLIVYYLCCYYYRIGDASINPIVMGRLWLEWIGQSSMLLLVLY